MTTALGSGVSPQARRQVQRKPAPKAQLITSAHRINQGTVPDLSKPPGDSDFYFVEANDPDVAVPRIVELVKSHIPRRFGLDPIRDVQVLCPMNRGGVGARSLNVELQAALNPAGERKVERFGWTLRRATKSCRSRTTTRRRSITAISAPSKMSTSMRVS
jgi:exodeoxyribonuclease V alpha subunit